MNAANNMSSQDLERAFDEAMMSVYTRALAECGYKATRFLRMLTERRGIETARSLLHAGSVSEGYVALWERKRLDLAVESVILDRKWHDLFTDQERDIARQRLADYGYEPAAHTSGHS